MKTNKLSNEYLIRDLLKKKLQEKAREEGYETTSGMEDAIDTLYTHFFPQLNVILNEVTKAISITENN